MRCSGWVQHARDLGPHDHLCWSYADAAEFRLRAREFLLDGLAAGQRVCYVGSGDIAELTADLTPVPALADALRTGAAQVSSLDATYPTGRVVDPEGQVRVYAEATERALDAGHTGLRVAANATALVRTPEQLAAFTRYEHLIDRYMSTNPFSAMCGYDRDELGEEALVQLACMHPRTNEETAGFRLHAPTTTGHAAALGGELDMSTRALFALALDRADLRPENGELVLDAAELTFIDHTSLQRLAGHAADRGATLVLRTGWPGAERIARVLGLRGVRVEQVA